MLNIIKLAVYSITGVLVSSYLIENEMKNADTVVEKPIDIVSIIMPSYNEEMFIKESVKSIREQAIVQQYPEMFEFILVDSDSTDKTVELAKPYVDKIIMVGKGKLAARNIATDQAKGNIIIAVDADSLYPPYSLNALLKPFKNDNVIATKGSIYDYSVPWISGQLLTIIDYIGYGVLNNAGMNGGNSAYRKQAFYKTGRFNTDIDNTDFKSVSDEEEIHFYEKLSALGDIVFVINAPKIHLGGIKVGCRHNLSEKEVCEIIGIGKSRF